MSDTTSLNTVKKGNSIKRMDIKEFEEKGFLREANRCFFHPLGLALEVTIDDKGEVYLSGVWDYRDMQGGIFYPPDLYKDDEKRETVESLRESQLKYRFDEAKKDGIEVDKNGVQIK